MTYSLFKTAFLLLLVIANEAVAEDSKEGVDRDHKNPKNPEGGQAMKEPPLLRDAFFRTVGQVKSAVDGLSFHPTEPIAYTSPLPIYLFVGAFSSGKSSLIDNLLECSTQDVESMICQQIGKAPMDSHVTIITHGSAAAKINLLPLQMAIDSDLLRFPISAVRDLKGAMKNEKIDVRLLDRNILNFATLIDTPGLEGNSYSGYLEDLMVLAKYSTKIFFLISIENPAKAKDANDLMARLKCDFPDKLQLLYTHVNMANNQGDYDMGMQNIAAALGRITCINSTDSGAMGDTIKIKPIYTPNPVKSPEEALAEEKTAHIALNEFKKNYDNLKNGIIQSGTLYWTGYLSETITYVTAADIYVSCVKHQQTEMKKDWLSRNEQTIKQELKACIKQVESFYSEGSSSVFKAVEMAVRSVENIEAFVKIPAVTEVVLKQLKDAKESLVTLKGLVRTYVSDYKIEVPVAPKVELSSSSAPSSKLHLWVFGALTCVYFGKSFLPGRKAAFRSKKEK